METQNPHRLTRTVTPSHYRLELTPDLDAATFAGRVGIEVEVHQPTDFIELNSIELDLRSAAVMIDGQFHDAIEIELDEEYERARLRFNTALPVGPVSLGISFSGILNDKLRGFYRSTYTDEAGQEHTLATTQFESTDARRAFPCWDEPDLKATFDVSLTVPEEMMAVSAQSEVSATLNGDGTRTVRFGVTPIMSTYLLAFVVGELEATDPIDVGGIPVRIVHTPGRGDLAQWTLQAGAFCLRWLTEYFDITYPGDKIDLVAIPDFASGAMENMGCITFREILLLVDPDTTTQPEQQRAVDVIAHELAHMWFGDLVTMRWWEGLWLKEAFATFMEMLTTDAFRPAWKRWVDFGLSRTAAFDIDSLESTRPIEFEVVSPADADGMYDLLTYEKGAAVVRMLEQFLGAEVFRTGIRHYMDKHSFGNTDTSDLWDALEQTSGQPVRTMMDSWIFQGGYPVVTVEQTSPATIKLSQQQFRYRNVDPSAQWGVPVVLTLGTADGRHDQRVLLDQPSIEVQLDTAAEWVLVNTDGSGFYRALYTEVARASLLDALHELSPIERYGIVDDAWAQVVAGNLGAAEFVSLTDRFADDTDLAVWRRIVGGYATLDHLASGDDRPKLQAHLNRLIGPRLDALGTSPVDGEDELTTELRGVLIGALGSLAQNPDIQALCRSIDGDPHAHPSLKAAAVGVIADTGNRQDFAEFVHRFETADNPQDERRYVQSLARFGDATDFDTMLAMSLSGKMRTQDAPYVLGAAMNNRTHGPRAWRFIVDNWEAVNEAFPANSISRMLTGIRSLSTPDLAAEVVEFIRAHPTPQGAKQIDQHLERLAINVELAAREAPRLSAAFAASE